MKRRWHRGWWWLVLILPAAFGLTRLRFDVEVLNLLPSEVPAVQGLKLYQQHFANARELIITVRSSDPAAAASTAQTIAERLRRETDLVADVTWQPPWLEHPEQAAELIAHLWFNQPPEIFGQLADRLAKTNLAAILTATREQLTTTLSPADLAQLSYDPFGLTRLPESVIGATPRFGEGEEMFASAEGTFRILYVKARGELNGYRACSEWFEAVKRAVNVAEPAARGAAVGYTGRPAFVAEISGSMRRDMVLSIGGTSLIIAVLFWLAHHRWKPMLWLLTLLALILAGTLGLGGLFLGTINAVSIGFAAILLGLAVDYAVVHYQEALAHPDLSVPEIRRAIAPSIFWAAVTTIAAFLVLNFGGLPGLAQLGSLVGVGMALSACVMIFAFLPPLFPDRMRPKPDRAAAVSAPEKPFPVTAGSSPVKAEGPSEKAASGSTGYQPVPSGDSPDGMASASFANPDAGFGSMASPIPVSGSPTGTGESPVPPIPQTGSERNDPGTVATVLTPRDRAAISRKRDGNEKPQSEPDEAGGLAGLNPVRVKVVFTLTAALILFCTVTLFFGLPGMETAADVMQPRDSQAYATLNAIKEHLGRNREPLWLIVAGRNENEVARRLDAVEPALQQAVSNHTLAGFALPTMLWPRPENQARNRATAKTLTAGWEGMRESALANGFAEEALGLTRGILDTWHRAVAANNTFWPTNQLCTWILEKLAARTPPNFYAAGFLHPGTNHAIANATAFEKLEAQLPREGVWLSSWDLLGGAVLSVVKGNLWKLLLPMIGLVLLSVWLAFRRWVEILLSLIILSISAVCLLAVMRLAGWSWNLLNLMALPLILGTGVDYSLFMLLALRRHHGDLRVTHRSVGRALLLCGGTAVSGFASLALSGNAGMASLGQVCAVGIGCNMLISVYLLPVWWRSLRRRPKTHGFRLSDGPATDPLETRGSALAQPSASYRAGVWRCGLVAVRVLPDRVCRWLSIVAAACYQGLRPQRCQVVVENLLPVLDQDRLAAERAARVLFQNFALKIADLWLFESGKTIDHWLTEWSGWEILAAAQARGPGVLIVTPHLGNWEFGGAFLAQRGCKLLVLTQPEPGQVFTELRQAARSRRGIETLVVGQDAFAFVEIIQRLQAGATVALLMDRPSPPTAVTVKLFGRPFQASIAAAELARASGCAVVPVYVVRQPAGYAAHILPEFTYDRAALGNRGARIELTQEILRAFEPAIRQHAEQWYHFVPIWPQDAPRAQ